MEMLERKPAHTMFPASAPVARRTFGNRVGFLHVGDPQVLGARGLHDIARRNVPRLSGPAVLFVAEVSIWKIVGDRCFFGTPRKEP